MAVIQKRLLGRGTESMAQRKMRMGRMRERNEADTMWLRMMTKKHSISDLDTMVLYRANTSFRGLGNNPKNLSDPEISSFSNML